MIPCQNFVILFLIFNFKTKFIWYEKVKSGTIFYDYGFMETSFFDCSQVIWSRMVFKKSPKFLLSFHFTMAIGFCEGFCTKQKLLFLLPTCTGNLYKIYLMEEDMQLIGPLGFLVKAKPLWHTKIFRTCMTQRENAKDNMRNVDHVVILTLSLCPLVQTVYLFCIYPLPSAK